MTAMVRACLVDVYDTILKSFFIDRVTTLVEPLGVNVEDWLAEFEKTREDRDRGKITTADAFARALRGCGIEPADGQVDDLMRRDLDYTYAHTRLYDDTIPFAPEWR